MNVDKVWGYYRESTQKVSDVVRHSAYAGIALLWTLRSENHQQFDTFMEMSAVLLVVTLMLDTFQHVIACYKLKALGKEKEAQCGELLQGVEDKTRCQQIWRECTSQEFDMPKNFYLAPLICFWLKVFTATSAYVSLLFTAARQLTK